MTDTISFAHDVKPMFREKDRDAMLQSFDLWNRDDVATHADAILASVSSGDMPCDERWTPDQVAILKRWIEAGKPA